MRIGGIEIPCAVLADGQRVLTQQGFLGALGRARSAKGGQGATSELDGGGVDKLPAFMAADNLKPFVPSDLVASTMPVAFRTLSGSKAFGFPAELLPTVCDVYLAARQAKKLHPTQEKVAERAEILVRGLARVGIRALIDEATGFQFERPRKDLEEYLEKFLSENLRRWVRTFPSDYFKHLCRLRGVELREDMRLPRYFGLLTNNMIYRRVAPGLLRKLKDRKHERGAPSNKLHSWLSEDIGVREILVHLGVVVGLMKINTNYDAFVAQLDRVAPIYPESPGLFDNPSDWDSAGDD
jgi:hypothetical protein